MLDLLRDCISKEQTDIATSIIDEKQGQSNVDYSLITKLLKENKPTEALDEVNKVLKENGLQHSQVLISAKTN